MEEQPVISVVIPVYNRKELLEEALQSVEDQTWKDYECIVVDDGSDDGTCELMSRYPGIRYIRQDHTGMPGAPRNRGVTEAGGEWIAFLDSDDLWLPRKLERQTAVLDEMTAAGMSSPLIHTREIWDRGGRTVSQRKQKHARDGDLFADSLKKCIIGPSTVLIHRETFLETGGFNEELEIAEDYELWLRITDRYPVRYIDEPLVVKRAGIWDQLSEKYGMIEIFRIEALEQLVYSHEWSSRRNASLAVTELRRKYGIHIQGLEKRGKASEAVEYRGRAKRLEERFRDLLK